MAKIHSRRLVIDASVARSAGGLTATEPRARDCREFLLSVLNICHQVVMTPGIAAEWKRHQSSFARTWRVQMEARKKVFRPIPVTNATLRRRCEEVFPLEAAREAALKDIHLIEAGLAADKAIVSLDDVARALFVNLSRSARQVGAIAWVNPGRPDDQAQDWLAAGAPDEDHRRLGAQR